MRTIRVAFFVGLLFGGCTKSVNRCESNDDCSDVAYPFCDVLGVYPASGGEKGVCTVRPPDCPAETCGCTPGSTCSMGTLTTCAADGMSTTMTACDLGCGDTNDHCATFEPMFGVGVVLPQAEAVGGMSIPAGSTISTDTGVVLDKAGDAIALPHQLVAQVGAPDIQVFYAKSIVIDDVRILGGKPISIVTTGPLVVRGTVDVSATNVTAGPGATESGPMIGTFTSTMYAFASGGGGNGTAGAGSTAGGMAYVGTTLVGGGRGADATHGGGGGGGAIHLVSKSSVSVLGAIDASGGGGGASTNGAGGAGGTVVLEAPTVTVSGEIGTNGGAGNACANSLPSVDGHLGIAAATAPTCMITVLSTPHTIGGGDGGTGSLAPLLGKYFIGPTFFQGSGSGGAVGRVVVNGHDGGFSPAPGAVINAVVSVGTLGIH